MRFILFTHVSGKDSLQTIVRCAKELHSLVWGKAGRRGMIVAFHDGGWKEILEDHRRCVEHVPTKEEEIGTDFANRLAEDVERRTGLSTSPWLRVVTSNDLYGFLENLQGSPGKYVADFLAGGSGRQRFFGYDSPKIVDAILRLRSMDRGIPIFRVDQDVLFGAEKSSDAWEQLGRALDSSVALHTRLRANRFVGSSLFSSSYEIRQALDRGERLDWMRGFATRVVPAMHSSTGKLDGQAVRTLFGFDAQGRVDPRSAVVEIGAHPLHGVISGALLYQDPRTVIDLPPFSNMRQGVMWIDDHLRFVLHRALRHLDGFPDDPWDGTRPEVRKHRRDQSPDPEFARKYMTSVLLGCICDRWFCEDPVDAKCLPGERPNEPRSKRKTAFVDALGSAMKEAAFEREQKISLKTELLREALEAIRITASTWLELPDSTFGYAFASTLRGSSLADLDDDTKKAVEDLIDDMADYIDWALLWPQLTSVIRAPAYGEFAGDAIFRAQATRPRVENGTSLRSLGLQCELGELRTAVDSLADAVEEGMRRWDAQVPMLPSWLPISGTPVEGRLCLAIDVGGTNVRAGVFRVENGEVVQVKVGKQALVPDHGLRRLSSAHFHERIVDVAKRVMADAGITGKDVETLGYSFSYPSTPLPNGDVVLNHWTKELFVSDTIGKPVGELLSDALSKAGVLDSPPHFTRVMNDTIAVLASCPDANLGLIVGTGFNVSARLPIKSLKKIEATRETPVNSEIGSAGPQLLGPLDDVVDAYSRNPGRQRLEKAISGGYLFQIYREVVGDRSVQDSRQVFDIADKGSGVYKKAAEAIVSRSADLAAVALAAVGRQLDVSKLVVCAEGSFLKHQSYQDRLKRRLDELSGNECTFHWRRDETNRVLHGAARVALLP